MKTTLIPTYVPWTTPAVKRFGSAPIAMLPGVVSQGSGLSRTGYGSAVTAGTAIALGTSNHLSAFAGVREDATGVPPRGRPV